MGKLRSGTLKAEAPAAAKPAKSAAVVTTPSKTTPGGGKKGGAAAVVKKATTTTPAPSATATAAKTTPVNKKKQGGGGVTVASTGSPAAGKLKSPAILAGLSAMSTRATRSSPAPAPTLVKVVVEEKEKKAAEPEVPKPKAVSTNSNASSPKKGTTTTTPSSPTKAKEAKPTLVSVKDDDAPPRGKGEKSMEAIVKAVTGKTVPNMESFSDKIIKKKKKKKILKKTVPTGSTQKPSVPPKLDFITAAVSIMSQGAATASAQNVSVKKDPAKGIITVKKLKPKVKPSSSSAAPSATVPGGIKKAKQKVKPTSTSASSTSSGIAKKKPPISTIIKTEEATKPSVSSGAPGETTTTPAQPPKKKKFFKDSNPEIKITSVGAAVHVQKMEKEKFSIYKLYHEMRESCVISDRWCIPEPMWDPHTNREVLLCYEVDVLMDGSVRMKRCLKILENFELIVILDGSDKTHLFKDKHPYIRSSQELLDLIRRVTMIKVCSGIKDCDPSDFDSIMSKVKERGGSWFSTECNVEVEKGCLGNICKRCTSLRNTLRRKMKRSLGLDNSTTSQTSTTTPNRTLLSNTVKPVLRTVGEALYTNLEHMSGGNRIPLDDLLPPPPPRSSTQVLHPELGIYMNSDLKERLDELAANPPPPLMKMEHVVEFDPRTMTRTLKRVQTPILPASFRHLISNTGGGRSAGSKRMKTDQQPTYVMGSNGELSLVQTATGETIQLPEGYVLADDSSFGDNIVVQKLDGQEDQFIVGEDNSIVVGSNFTLEDGEEYEVIGEAASGEGDSIQVLPLNTNSDIEIIEVDENMIQLVDENSQPEIQPVDSSSDIFKFLQAQSRLHV